MKNDYKTEGDKVYIYLRNIDKWTIIDLKDFELANTHTGRWMGLYEPRINNYYVTGHTTSKNGAKSIPLKLHRWLLGVTDTKTQTDHKNHNTLDNTRNNICPVTCLENMQNKRHYKTNTSGKRGVSWHKRIQRWYAYIRVNKKSIHLGYFNTVEEAEEAYNQARYNYQPYKIKCEKERKYAI